ncbi:hypothetical protein [Sulfurirhabdus autotrophica]|uniref:Uncharacterized protein n=1 Tax=Sulfurirhabdus autotrophica TaxID=1706046 RepID=A0A4R3Y143_9PROT|nr:hypothetical protein [Sulfurirhabdus autotrophica]TCV85825.1 hypothetical protein EDC63_10833 [Sulfurirhabdus autotrophica]
MKVVIILLVLLIEGCVSTQQYKFTENTINNGCANNHTLAWCVVEYGNFTDGYANNGKEIKTTKTLNNSPGSAVMDGVASADALIRGTPGLPGIVTGTAAVIYGAANIKKDLQVKTTLTDAGFNHVCAMMPKSMAKSNSDAADQFLKIFEKGMVDALPQDYSGKLADPDSSAQFDMAKKFANITLDGNGCGRGCYLFTPRANKVQIGESIVPDWVTVKSAVIKPGDSVWTMCSPVSKFWFHKFSTNTDVPQSHGYENYPFSEKEFFQNLSAKLPDWFYLVIAKHKFFNAKVMQSGETYEF